MVGNVCVQLILQFYTDEFETLQALLSSSVDVRMVLAFSSIWIWKILKFRYFESLNTELYQFCLNWSTSDFLPFLLGNTFQEQFDKYNIQKNTII